MAKTFEFRYRKFLRRSSSCFSLDLERKESASHQKLIYNCTGSEYFFSVIFYKKKIGIPLIVIHGGKKSNRLCLYFSSNRIRNRLFSSLLQPRSQNVRESSTLLLIARLADDESRLGTKITPWGKSEPRTNWV